MKDRFGRPVGKARSRAFTRTIGCAALAVAATAAYVGYQAANTVPGRGYYNLRAEFRDANNLANHYEVRIGGVRAGQVLNPRVQGDKAVVDLRLSDRFKPLLNDTRMQVRLRSAIGVRYLELYPGTEGQPLGEGATLPSDNVRPSVALDEVLGTFDPTTRSRAAELMNQLGVGVMNRGGGLNGDLGAAAPVLSDMGTVARTITARPGAMADLIRATDRAAGAVDPVRQAMANGFAPEAAAARIFADKGDEIRSTLAEAPPALAAISSGLPKVDALVAQVGALARESLATLEVAPDTFRKTTKMVRVAEAPVDQLKSTLALTGTAVPPALRLLNSTKPVLPGVDRAMDNIRPTVNYMEPRACELTNAWTTWSSIQRWRDDKGTFARFSLDYPRPDQAAGMIPGGKVGQSWDKTFWHLNPYPGPCHGDEGENGPLNATPEEDAKGLTYSSKLEPGQG